MIWRRQSRFAPAEPKALLFCIPPAGASATWFGEWQQALAPSVEVLAAEIPRLEDERPTPDDLVGLAAAFADEACERVAATGLPYSFYGHSLGALLAFESVLSIEARGLDTAELVIVSGANAPGSILMPPASASPSESLRRFGMTPSVILHDPDLAELFGRRLQADAELLRRYRPSPGQLTSRLHVALGETDIFTSRAASEDWAERASKVEFHSFAGDHAFPVTHRPELLSFVRHCVASTFGPVAEDRREIVRELCAEVFALNDPATDVNFFDLGGNSLQIVQLQSMLEARLSCTVPLLDLFRYPTIDSLVAHLATVE